MNKNCVICGKPMKSYILMLAKVFPATHSRCGDDTDFLPKLAKQKIHTIRNVGKWEKRVTEINAGKAVLSLRMWTGKPYHSKMVEIARYTTVGLQHVSMSYSADMPLPTAYVDGNYVSVYDLAENDGLELPDFIEWMFPKDNVYDGVILHFTDFRY